MMYQSQFLVGSGSNADIDTSEEDIVTVTDETKLKVSQLSLFVAYALGTNTSLTLRAYARSDKAGDWHAIPKQNLADNTIDAWSFVIDANTPATPIVIDLAIGAYMAFKVTGQGAGGANSTSTIKILGRDN